MENFISLVSLVDVIKKMLVSTEQVSNFLKQHGNFIVYKEPANNFIFNGASALNKLGYWHWIKCFDPNQGFMYSENKYVEQLANELESDGHTGATLACTMRFLQRIAKDLVKGDGPYHECVICHCDEYCGDKTILDCGHIFHKNCIQSWFNTGANKTCPSCRGDTIPDYNARLCRVVT